MDGTGCDLSFFGSMHVAQGRIMWEEVDCNTYRLEITNEGYTLDGCRLDALCQRRAWSGREKKIHPERNYFVWWPMKSRFPIWEFLLGAIPGAVTAR